MHDPLIVSGIECAGDLLREPKALLDGWPSSFDALCERVALDELHDDRVHRVVVVDAVDGRDVWMVDRGQRPRFALEARQAGHVGVEFRWENFDRDLSTELRIAGAEYL